MFESVLNTFVKILIEYYIDSKMDTGNCSHVTDIKKKKSKISEIL